jgi:hypothetical protein
MDRGVLIFAHNSREVDYVLMAMIAGGLAKKHLNVSVSIVTDETTLNWARESKIYEDIKSIFENIILIDKPTDDNFRNLRDGDTCKKVPFNNSNRSSVYELTPYDTTLLIDSDFLIFTDQLNNYWELDYDVMIGRSINDILGNRSEMLDRRVSEVGPHLFWATTVMFKKNASSKTFFDLVSFIKENYNYYADLYRFDPRQYRNDISFSIAKHILNGFGETLEFSLPDITTILDTDILHDVNDDAGLQILVNDKLNPQKYFLSLVKHTDIHILNKQSIIRNKTNLLRLI